MSDLQPEKWLLLANRAFSESCELEVDPQKRVLCMKSMNKKEIISRDMLREVARQQLVGPETFSRFYFDMLLL